MSFIVIATLFAACARDGGATASTTPPKAQEQRPVAQPAPRASTSADAAASDPFAELDGDAGFGIRPVPGCTELAGANGCTGVGATMLLCTGLGNLFVEPATARLVECLTRHNGSEALCGTEALKKCALDAIAPTEAAPQTPAICQELLKKCAPPAGFEDLFKPEICRDGLSSLRAEPRSELVACMRKGCDLALCFGGLL